ncbi:MAG: xanthine phosphoribosyltransferase [Tissierella sp.]|uniref:xanthine phosphoribosyltransferase n=1 Tax=Tissierella sp. TaxID=41274 RepID=UPI003F98884C
MDILKERIKEDAKVLDGQVVKVDSFLNHQVDIDLLNEMGKEFKERFKDEKIDKILTAEVSGIAIACIVAQYFKVPMVFARKTESKNLDSDKYESEVYSYTKGRTYKVMVSKRYLKKDKNILIIDDFLANGKAVESLIDIVNKGQANLIGVGVAIEKGFQAGGKTLRKNGIKLESLTIIDSIENGQVRFR